MDRHLLRGLYRLAVEQQKDGSIRGNHFIPLTIAEHDWKLRYSADRGTVPNIDRLAVEPPLPDDDTLLQLSYDALKSKALR